MLALSSEFLPLFQATSLQLQLDRALSDLKSLNNQCSTLVSYVTYRGRDPDLPPPSLQRSLVAAKDEKLQIFQQKLAEIKAAVTKELYKVRTATL